MPPRAQRRAGGSALTIISTPAAAVLPSTAGRTPWTGRRSPEVVVTATRLPAIVADTSAGH
jgi:hypothetical protein